MKKFFSTLLFSALFVSVWAAKGDMVNIVCFVRFADEPETVFTHNLDFYDTLFNNEASDANSVSNYFSWVSYGQLKWKTIFNPQTKDTQICSYQDILTRKQLQKYDATNNPEGYHSGYESASLEHELVARVAAYLDSTLSNDIKLDNYKPGTIDNLTIIYSGNSETSSGKGILWPHQDNILLSASKIKGCRVPRYIAVFDNANGYKSLKPVEINTGVLCHEMTHLFGAYDLYTSSTDTSNPVGTWDLMSDNNIIPQGLTAYMRWYWGEWISEIPELTEDGEYSLHPVGSASSENVAFRIVPSKAASEYFIIEYRKKEGVFESGIPASGLICYRISTSASGNLSNPKEMYIFRQNGTANYRNAVLTADIGITEGNTDKSPFKYTYSNGTPTQFTITNVGSCGESISFHFTKDKTSGISQATVDTKNSSATYNLEGKRVASTTKGIVIQNGKKVLTHN